MDMQYSYTAFVLEGFAIYISVKRLGFYLQNDECNVQYFVTIYSFLKGKTENNNSTIGQ